MSKLGMFIYLSVTLIPMITYSFYLEFKPPDKYEQRCIDNIGKRILVGCDSMKIIDYNISFDTYILHDSLEIKTNYIHGRRY